MTFSKCGSSKVRFRVWMLMVMMFSISKTLLRIKYSCVSRVFEVISVFNRWIQCTERCRLLCKGSIVLSEILFSALKSSSFNSGTFSHKTLSFSNIQIKDWKTFFVVVCITSPLRHSDGPSMALVHPICLKTNQKAFKFHPLATCVL